MNIRKINETSNVGFFFDLTQLKVGPAAVSAFLAYGGMFRNILWQNLNDWSLSVVSIAQYHEVFLLNRARGFNSHESSMKCDGQVVSGARQPD